MDIIEFLRQFRVADYAVFDFVVSFIGIYFLAPLLSKIICYLRVYVSRLSWLYLTLPLSILIHLLTGNITPMTRDFIDTDGHYLLKIGIIILVVLGVRGMKIVKAHKSEK